MNKPLGLLIAMLVASISVNVFAADPSKYYEKGPIPKGAQKKEKPGEVLEGTKEYVGEKAVKAKKDMKKAGEKIKKRRSAKTVAKKEPEPAKKIEQGTK